MFVVRAVVPPEDDRQHRRDRACAEQDEAAPWLHLLTAGDDEPAEAVGVLDDRRLLDPRVERRRRSVLPELVRERLDGCWVHGRRF